MQFEILTEVYRGKNINGKLTDPLLESVHLGVVAVVDEDGNELFSTGDTNSEFYIRSAAKPFQVIPLLESGAVERFKFTDEELALMCASHNAEEVHIKTASSILRKTGLDERYLGCGSHWPMHVPTAESMLSRHVPLNQLYNNCSGKHGGMLAYCVFHNLPLETYLDFNHPLQKQIHSLIEKMLVRRIKSGTDGCSAPVFVMKVREMAFLYALLGAGKTAALATAFRVMHDNPYMVAGDERFDTDLMQNSPVTAKIGAEGIECIAVPRLNGQKAFGITVKISDGNFRALYPVIISLMKKFNLLSGEQIRALKKYDPVIIYNHRKMEVGFIKSSV